MKLFLQYTPLLISLLTSIGCSATGPKFTNIVEPVNDNAVAYVFRPWKYVAGATYPVILVNNQDEYKLKNGSYFRIELPPGNHNFSIKDRFDWVSWKTWKKQEIELNMRANGIYYIAFSISLDDMRTTYATPQVAVTTIKTTNHFIQVEEEVALSLLKNTNLVQQTK